MSISVLRLYLTYKEKVNQNIPEKVNINNNNLSYILAKTVKTEEELIDNIDTRSIANLDVLIVSKLSKFEAEANNNYGLFSFNDPDNAERYPYWDLFDMINPWQEIYIFKRVKTQEKLYPIEKIFDEYLNKEFYLYTDDVNYFKNKSDTKLILELDDHDFYLDKENKIEVSVSDFKKYLEELDIKDDWSIILWYTSEYI